MMWSVTFPLISTETVVMHGAHLGDSAHLTLTSSYYSTCVADTLNFSEHRVTNVDILRPTAEPETVVFGCGDQKCASTLEWFCCYQAGTHWTTAGRCHQTATDTSVQQ